MGPKMGGHGMVGGKKSLVSSQARRHFYTERHSKDDKCVINRGWTTVGHLLFLVVLN